VLGAEVERSQRFSKLVSDDFGATEYNIAYGGRGNMMSLALTIAHAEVEQPDYIVFGVSSIYRTFGLTDPDANHKFNDLAYWNSKQEYQENFAVNFSFSPTMSAKYDPNINKYLPIYRNNLQAHLELACITTTLSEYSRQSGIPVCVFPALNIKDYIQEISNTPVLDTVLNPRNSPVWLDCDFDQLARKNQDRMVQGHPGALTHREFSAIIIERIKRDLNERNTNC
jgi:hypothetical protein